MSAEEADKTTTTDASAGDEEEEWLYGGDKNLRSLLTDIYEYICCSITIINRQHDLIIRGNKLEFMPRC